MKDSLTATTPSALVYWESFDEVHKAIAREKQRKKWRRERKLWLIARMNPKVRDLAAG